MHAATQAARALSLDEQAARLLLRIALITHESASESEHLAQHLDREPGRRGDRPVACDHHQSCAQVLQALFVFFEEHRTSSALLREAVLRACGWAPVPHAPLTGSRAHVAAVILDEISSLPVEPFGLPLPRDPRLQRIARALIADPSDDRDLERWAAWGAVSSRTLSRRFVTETGFSFTAWRQRARRMRSLEMLAARMPVTDIALDLGYATPSAFIGRFRRAFGETSAAYRGRL